MSVLTVAEWRLWKDAPTKPDDYLIDSALAAAESAAADVVGRNIVEAGASSARLFTPEYETVVRGQVLRIHDCHTVTSVTIDGSVVAPADYQLEPVNQLSWSGKYRPYEQIRLLRGEWTIDRNRATVSVVAAWGWLAIPAEYVEAVKILSADILAQADIRNGLVFTEYAASRVRENAVVNNLLTRLVRPDEWGIA